MNIVPRAEAKSNGDTWYFTGKPCKNGHIAARQVSNGGCYECHRSREEARDRTEQQRQYRIDNREWIREKNRAYARANKEKRQQWLRENRERVRKKAREYADRNADAIAEYKRRYYQRRYREDVMFKCSQICRSMVWRCIGRGSTGKRTEALLGYSADDLCAHIEAQFSEGMRWDNYGEWHVDHIYPVSLFVKSGETDPSVINALSNLRPMWASDNQSKGAALPEGSAC